MDAIPHLAVPFRVQGGKVITVEQGSAEEIEQCVEACLKTPLGSRIDAPGYGVPDGTFRTQGASLGPEPYLAAIEAAEPRADLVGDARLSEMVEQIVLRWGRSP